MVTRRAALLRRHRTTRSRAAAPSRCAGGARRCSRCARSPGRRSPRSAARRSRRSRTSTPSVAISALYCVVSEASGSVRMRTKSSTFSESSSTRIGRRPCSSGIRSEGFDRLNAPGGDEQDVIGLHRPVLRVDRGAFDERQQVALHALARHVRADASPGGASTLSISSMNTMPFCSAFGERLHLELFLVDELARLLHRSGASAPPCTFTLRVRVRLPPRFCEHGLQLLLHLLHARRRHDLHAHRQRAQLDLDLALVELPFAQHLAEFLPRLRIARLRGLDRSRSPSLRGCGSSASSTRSSAASCGALAHLLDLLLARHLHGDVRQLLDDGVDVAAHVADFGELGGLDFHERRVARASRGAARSRSCRRPSARS